MENTYKINIAGLERELPLCEVNEHLDIAAFICFGDVELTIAVCSEFLKRVPEFDVILTPEAKSIPLAYELSRQSGKKYVVARKGTKIYMRNPISVNVRSITTNRLQTLYLGEDDVNDLTGKRVLIVDDVVSTGESLNAVRELIKNIDCTEVATCTVFAEGDAAKRDDIIFLNALQVFPK